MPTNLLRIESENHSIFEIQVTPEASRAEISCLRKEALTIKVIRPPMENSAIAAFLRLLAKELDLTKNRFEIFTGLRLRNKNHSG